MSGPGIFFRILGPLTAELGPAGPAGSAARPAELDAGPFKQRLLLALLLCRCNGVVLTEQVIDTLWWDGPPRTAHKNVHVYITHLRKLLAADGQPGRLRYRARLAGPSVTQDPAPVAQALVHMHCNRLAGLSPASERVAVALARDLAMTTSRPV